MLFQKRALIVTLALALGGADLALSQPVCDGMFNPKRDRVDLDQRFKAAAKRYEEIKRSEAEATQQKEKELEPPTVSSVLLERLDLENKRIGQLHLVDTRGERGRSEASGRIQIESTREPVEIDVHGTSGTQANSLSKKARQKLLDRIAPQSARTLRKWLRRGGKVLAGITGASLVLFLANDPGTFWADVGYNAARWSVGTFVAYSIVGTVIPKLVLNRVSVFLAPKLAPLHWISIRSKFWTEEYQEGIFLENLVRVYDSMKSYRNEGSELSAQTPLTVVFNSETMGLSPRFLEMVSIKLKDIGFEEVSSRRDS